MSPLSAWVLLDTGPDERERRHIESLFAGVGVSSTVEGHSYGGPPPTSAFRIVVNVPVDLFLARFRQHGEPEPARLTKLVRALLAVRADPLRWGRPHSLVLEDEHADLTVDCAPGVPDEAIAGLLSLDLRDFGYGSPTATVRWYSQYGRWLARVEVGGRTLLRRLPARRSSERSVRVRQLSRVELDRLRRVTEQTPSVVRWQRAYVVLLNAQGWSVSAIANQMVLSRPTVRRIVADFNRSGEASLDPAYVRPQPFHPGPAPDREARAVVAAGPVALGPARPAWDVRTIADYLVGQGIAEDVDPNWLASALAEPKDRVQPAPGVG